MDPPSGQRVRLLSGWVIGGGASSPTQEVE